MARGMRKNVGRRGGGEEVVERGGNGETENKRKGRSGMEAGVEDGRGGLRKVSRMIDKNGRVNGGNGSPEGG